MEEVQVGREGAEGEKRVEGRWQSTGRRLQSAKIKKPQSDDGAFLNQLSNKNYFVGTVVVVVDSAVAAPAAAPVSVPAAAGTVVVVVSAGAVVVSFLVQAAAATATKAINAKFLKFIGFSLWCWAHPILRIDGDINSVLQLLAVSRKN